MTTPPPRVEEPVLIELTEKTRGIVPLEVTHLVEVILNHGDPSPDFFYCRTTGEWIDSPLKGTLVFGTIIGDANYRFARAAEPRDIALSKLAELEALCPGITEEVWREKQSALISSRVEEVGDKPRFFVDKRVGCIAVRDRTLTDPDYSGLHDDTEGVVWYRHGIVGSEWSVDPKHVAEAKAECERLNAPTPPVEAAAGVRLAPHETVEWAEECLRWAVRRINRKAPYHSEEPEIDLRMMVSFEGMAKQLPAQLTALREAARKKDAEIADLKSRLADIAGGLRQVSSSLESLRG